VPPIIVALTTNPFLFEVYDLSSVKAVVNGASGIDQSLADKLHAQQPSWKLLAGYGPLAIRVAVLEECELTLAYRADGGRYRVDPY
jgi:hypothetical protein